MSPLLSTRPSEAVTHRLLAACGVTALLALAIAVSAGDTGRPTGAAPMFLTAGAVCAALVAYLLFASARAVEDDRLHWMAAGVTVAALGLIATIAGQATVFPNNTVVSRSPDAAAARYLVWHTALAAAAVLAVLRRPAHARAFPRLPHDLRAGAGLDVHRRDAAGRPRREQRRLRRRA